MRRVVSAIYCTAVAGTLGAQELPVPSRVQLEWQQLETTAFIHFNINTFTDAEWGYGNESPTWFAPSDVDCRQWARTCKAAGLKGVILTAKHHDGFCLWPSKYTEHSVKNSPWRNGEGDLVREFVNACHEYGLKVGLYLSPWDCNHPDYGKPEYITYFKNQLRELLTNYGDLYEFWFDGANGGRGYYGTDSLHVRKIPSDYYPWEELTQMVYEYQPDCVVHGGSLANIRWVGNEQGYALEEHWSVMRSPELYDKQVTGNMQLMRGHADGTIWKPSEVDVSIRPGWYYHSSEDHKLKSVARLTDIYYESVGRNSLLLLNLTPNKEGRIPQEDSIRLCEWYKRYTSELSRNLLSPSVRTLGKQIKKIELAFDGDRETFCVATTCTPILELDFGKELTFNRLLLQEYIEKGQRIKAFEVEIMKKGNWQLLDKQTTIGYKRILRFPSVSTSKLRIRIADAWNFPMLSEIQLFNAETVPDAPVISRNKDGMVRLTCADPTAFIYYTQNGEIPQIGTGQVYHQPFHADGKVQIAAIAVNGERTSSVSVRSFEKSKFAWSTLPEEAGKLIFDEDKNTRWMGKNLLEIDMKECQEIFGISYLPDQSRWATGIVVNYRIEGSLDGKKWSELCQGEFANIQNHPIEQIVRFIRPQKVRYIRLKALSTADGSKKIGVAEFDLLFE